MSKHHTNYSGPDGSVGLADPDGAPSTMFAAVLEQPRSLQADPLTIISLPVPTPGPGEVLIQLRCCGVCRTDLHLVEGELPLPKAPLIPGHQAIGIVKAMGLNVSSFRIGDRVGAAWLASTCGGCGYCVSGRENLCDHALFHGWSVNGGFAQYMTARAEFVYPIPAAFDDVQAAPLLCAGIIGYRAMRLTGLGESFGGWKGKRLGIYGFGAAGHVVIQLARGREAEVYVCTRDRHRHQALAAELGAAWVGGSTEDPPHQLDAAIIFAPSGELVIPALKSLRKGGVLVLAGIHMTDIPPIAYQSLYGERIVRTVANNTRQDGVEFLAEAARLPVRTHVRVFGLECVNEALRELKDDQIKGAAVLQINGGSI